jgi:hypothetical protein
LAASGEGLPDPGHPEEITLDFSGIYNVVMKRSIGVRELKIHASRILSRVRETREPQQPSGTGRVREENWFR